MLTHLVDILGCISNHFVSLCSLITLIRFSPGQNLWTTLNQVCLSFFFFRPFLLQNLFVGFLVKKKKLMEYYTKSHSHIPLLLRRKAILCYSSDSLVVSGNRACAIYVWKYTLIHWRINSFKITNRKSKERNERRDLAIHKHPIISMYMAENFSELWSNTRQQQCTTKKTLKLKNGFQEPTLASGRSSLDFEPESM